MAATTSMSTQPSLQQAPKKRFVWSTPMTRLLISLWEDHLPALRAQKHNAPIYWSMTEKFNEAASGSGDGAVQVTVKQLRHKLENLTQLFKAISKAPTGSAATECPFYDQMKFLGRLPMNDPSLVEESWQLEVVEEAPEDVEVLAVGTEAHSSRSSMIEGGSPGPQSAGESTPPPAFQSATVASGSAPASAQGPPPGPANGRKRSYNAGLDRIVQLLEDESKHAGKLRKAELKMSRQALRLQKQSIDLQREMNGIMAQYFGNKD
ncbi:uncharacterized protein LOC144172270 [Haemaphysalis longicornis]